MDACKAEGSPQPFWSEEGGYTVVTFPLNKLNGRIVTPNEPQNVTQNVTQNDIPRAEKVEQVVVENSMMSKDDLAKRFNVSSKTILRDLKKLGYAWEGASKNGRWVKKTPTSTNW